MGLGSEKASMGNEEDESWDSAAKNWESQDGVKEFSQHTCDLTLGLSPPTEGQKWSSANVLDLGSGTGLLSRFLSPHCTQIVSIDPSKAMIDVLLQRLEESSIKNIHPINGLLDDEMAEKLLAEEFAPFDAVVANSVCSFVPDYQGLLALIHKLLKPGGLFIQCDWKQQKEPFTENHSDGFHEVMLQKAYSDSGFDVVKIEPIALIGMPIIAGVGRKKS